MTATVVPRIVGSVGYDPTNVAVTGGTITGTNVPYDVYKSGIPIIGLSSGSVAANGAISAITALPVAYPNAYCYFPANILATTIAAGLYYCTFSTTTAGTAFLNTYDPTSGVPPTIPASPTAVTDGKGAFTGDTSERVFHTATIPANAVGINGYIEVETLWSYTNSAGAKTNSVRIGGAAGTQVLALNTTTTVVYSDTRRVHNRGSASVQAVVPRNVSTGPYGTTTTAPITAAIDTTAATTIVFQSTRATATDNHILEFACVGIACAS